MFEQPGSAWFESQQVTVWKIKCFISNLLKNLIFLPQGIFNDLGNLKNLTLHRNRLTNLTDGTFKGMSNLELLELSHNGIIDLPNGTFNGLSNLSNLILRDNQITNLTDGTFDGLSYLKKLTNLNEKFLLQFFWSCKSTNTSDVTVYDLNNISSQGCCLSLL